MEKSKEDKSKKIEEIFRAAANNYRYKWGIQQLEKLGRKNREMTRNYFFLCHLGLLYDHLALKKKGQERKKLEDKAIKFYQKAIKINPKFPGAVWGIGRVWWHRKSKKAVQYAKRAFRLAKTSDLPAGLYAQGVGLAYKALGDYKKSEWWFIKGIKEDPDDWGVYVNPALFYKNVKKDKRRVLMYTKKLEKLFQKSPRSVKETLWGKTIAKDIIREIKKWASKSE